MSKTTQYILASLGIIALLCLAIGLIGLLFAETISDLLMGNKKVYLNCDQLPDIQQVEAAIEDHSDMIKKIEEINPNGYIAIYSKDECPDKGGLQIVFGGYEQSVKIQALLGDKFFGIPYQLENQ